MSENVIQTSFSAGELSPNLFARVDFAKYRSGAATMRNFFVDYRSGASTRPGTEFIKPADIGSKKVRLVRFQQSVDVTYVLEFGNFYLRFISQGAAIVEPPIAIVGITQSNPVVVTAASAVPADTMVFISGLNGMPQLDDRFVYSFNVSGNTFQIFDGLTGVPINSTNFDPYISGGTVQHVYTIGTPYSQDELALLKFSQNASIMNITHPNHPPYVLTLISATNWTLVPATIGATVNPPTINSVSATAAGPAFYKYAVTSVDENGQEGQPSNVGLANNVLDMRLSTTGTPGGSVVVVYAGPISGGATSFNIYGSSPSYSALAADPTDLGYIGSQVAGPAGTFVDTNIAPDFSKSPPVHDNPFTSPTVNPAVSSYFQQRLVYANGGGSLVDTFWMSKVGAYYNFDFSNPSEGDDSVNGALVSLEVNEIKSMVPMPTGLIMLTTHGVWQVNGGAGGVASQGGPVTPATLVATPQAYIGANDVPPILVNYDIMFIQQKGSIVRDLTYNIYANIYTGNDVSILSSHLFYGHQILEWAYAEEPFKVIWCVRDDGILLSLTLVKEQDMYGWARHDTLGNFKSVCTVTEGTADATYFVVERPNPSGNGTCLCIERMHERTFEFGAEDAWCVDCGSRTTNNFPAANLTISAATGTVTVSADASVFTSAMVGWILRAGGGVIQVTQYVAPGQIVGNVVQPITDLLPNDPNHSVNTIQSGDWSIDKPFTKVFGLDFLEGRQVSVLADGGVINGLVVHSGEITLPSPATKVTVGYGFQAQLQTMYLDLGQEINTAQGKRKKVGALTVRVKDTRGIKAGMTFQTVTPIKELNRTTLMGFPVPLITADERIVMDPLWDIPGQICLQVDDPLPATVLGVIPEVIVGDVSK
jgi:hypothetical protein